MRSKGKMKQMMQQMGGMDGMNEMLGGMGGSNGGLDMSQLDGITKKMGKKGNPFGF